MDGYLQLSPQERKACLQVYRSDRQVSRALVLLLLDQGFSYRKIGASVFVSPGLVKDSRDARAEVFSDMQRNSCVFRR